MRGHVHKRQRTGKDGRQTTLWYVVVDIGESETGKRKQKWHGSFKTRRDAEAALAEIVRSLEQRTYVAPDRVSLSAFTRSEWLPTMATQVKTSTLDSYRRNLELHVLPILGGIHLQDLTAGHLNQMYRTLSTTGHRGSSGGGLSPKTIRNIHGTMSKVLADALDRGLIGRNVATSARPPKPRKTAARHIAFWTPPELAEFLEFMHDDRLYALWHLASMTGMRRGELLGLRWEDIDATTRRISIRQAVISVAYEVLVTTPKSHNARVIDVDAASLEVLARHRRQQAVERSSAGSGYLDNDRVFRKEDGSALHPDVVRTMFDRRVQRSGVRRIRFHDLRHTHATIGLRAGVPVKVMSERLGHSTPAFTMQQYAHVIPGMQAEAAEAIARLVSGPAEPVVDDSTDSLDGDDEE